MDKLLLTPKQRAKIVTKATKDNIGIFQTVTTLLQAQLTKANPQGAYNRGFEQGKFEERERIIAQCKVDGGGINSSTREQYIRIRMPLIFWQALKGEQ